MSRVTYDAGNLTIEVDGLDTVAAALGDLKKKTPAAAKVAINATARQARKLMIAKAKAAPERPCATEKGQQHQFERRAAHRKDAQRSRLFPAQADGVLYRARGFAPRAKVCESPCSESLVHGGADRQRQHEQGISRAVQERQIGSSSSHTVTERGHPRWRNKNGKVEKLVTMGSPSASAMHSTVWPMVEPEVSEYLQDRLMEQTERVLARAARRK